MDETQFCRSCENYAQQLAKALKACQELYEALIWQSAVSREGWERIVQPALNRGRLVIREVDDES